MKTASCLCNSTKQASKHTHRQTDVSRTRASFFLVLSSFRLLLLPFWIAHIVYHIYLNRICVHAVGFLEVGSKNNFILRVETQATLPGILLFRLNKTFRANKFIWTRPLILKFNTSVICALHRWFFLILIFQVKILFKRLEMLWVSM